MARPRPKYEVRISFTIPRPAAVYETPATNDLPLRRLRRFRSHDGPRRKSLGFGRATHRKNRVAWPVRLLVNDVVISCAAWDRSRRFFLRLHRRSLLHTRFVRRLWTGVSRSQVLPPSSAGNFAPAHAVRGRAEAVLLLPTVQLVSHSQASRERDQLRGRPSPSLRKL